MNTSKASTFTKGVNAVATRLAKRGMLGFVCAAVVWMMVGVQSGYAADLTWDITPGTVGAGDSAITGGTGDWNTSNGNWTTDAGTNNIAWDNTSPSTNTALLNANGIAGTGVVTLNGTINLKALTFSNLRNSGPVQKYTITGGTLAFASGGTITTGITLDNVNNAEYASINSAITGSPNVSKSWTSGNNVLVFAPTSGSQALGTVSGVGTIKLAGSTTGNTIVATTSTSDKIQVTSGTWTLTGTAIGYEHFIQGGTLIISTGSLQNNARDTTLSGTATLHWNNPGAIRDVTISTARDRDFQITGGSIDNSSGAAITTCTYNPQMRWNGNWTFIGSNGAASDLYLGNGDVFLTATRQVTVQNAATTLAVGGVISQTASGFGLTKAGAGTLELRANNTYSGATTITNGTLAGVVGGSCTNSAVTVASTGTLGVKVTNTNKQWTCKSVTVSAGTEAKLKFAFTGLPSTTLAPLKIIDAVTFTGVPTVVVDVAELSPGFYPLLEKGDGTALALPALNSSAGGSLAWSGDNMTLNLIVHPKGTLLFIR